MKKTAILINTSRGELVDEESLYTALKEKAISAFGKIDILINVAGIVISGRVDNTSEEEFVRTLDVNVKGTFLTANTPYKR